MYEKMPDAFAAPGKASDALARKNRLPQTREPQADRQAAANALWGEPAPAPELHVVASNWRRFDPPKNTLVAWLDLVIGLPIGSLRLHDCSFHVQGGSRLVGLPSRPNLDRENKALLSPKTGSHRIALVSRSRAARRGKPFDMQHSRQSIA